MYIYLNMQTQLQKDLQNRKDSTIEKLLRDTWPYLGSKKDLPEEMKKENGRKRRDDKKRVIEYLLCAQHRCKPLACIKSFHPYNSVKHILLLPPFDQQENWGTEMLSSWAQGHSPWYFSCF